MALLEVSGDRSTARVLSLACSVFEVALVSADMSFSWDMSEEQREWQPNFHGYLPTSLTRQAFCVTLMFFMSAFNLAIQGLTIVILSLKSVFLLLTVMVGEMTMYFVVKFVRRDLMYWYVGVSRKAKLRAILLLMARYF